MNENSVIEHIRKKARLKSEVAMGIGDDCAIYRPRKGEELLFTTDFVIEGRHFRRDTHTARQVGYKALARSLSDIAAMGGSPEFCLVGLAAPADSQWIDGFYDGLFALAAKTGTSLAGGDLSRSETIICDVMVCGSAATGTALRRGGAKPGDALYVTGALGGSAHGLATGKGLAWKKHLRPEPRLAIGQLLRLKYGATACIDLSDGLSTDLARLCKASGLCADLGDTLPFFRGATIEEALHGGEDYELLFTVPGKRRIPVEIAGVPITRIGSVEKGPAGRIFGEKREFEIIAAGFDHFETK
ncbi:MAG: thiamine-phosphate kinase [Candidatus Solibacter usitatus]|nr:thiamine-phosphate kinase [Candidatus Solibacter usitatus]